MPCMRVRSARTHSAHTPAPAAANANSRARGPNPTRAANRKHNSPGRRTHDQQYAHATDDRSSDTDLRSEIVPPVLDLEHAVLCELQTCFTVGSGENRPCSTRMLQSSESFFASADSVASSSSESSWRSRAAIRRATSSTASRSSSCQRQSYQDQRLKSRHIAPKRQGGVT